MALYLTRFSYTPATWAKLIKNPEDRREAAKQYIEAVGGKLQGFWYAFGDHDGYTLWEAPDNVSMAATALAIGAAAAFAGALIVPLVPATPAWPAIDVRARPKASLIDEYPPFSFADETTSTVPTARLTV